MQLKIFIYHINSKRELTTVLLKSEMKVNEFIILALQIFFSILSILHMNNQGQVIIYIFHTNVKLNNI